MRAAPIRTIWLAWLGLTIAAAAQPAGAQNLLTNAEFDTDISDWSHDSNPAYEFFVQSWSGLDHDASQMSGSLLVAGGDALMFQCVPVSAGASYALRGFTYEPSDADTDLELALGVGWYTGITCPFDSGAGSLISRDLLTAPATQNVWHSLGGAFVAPDGAELARVELRTDVLSGAFNAEAHFDAVFLPEPGSDTAVIFAALGVVAAALRPAGRSSGC